MFIEYDRPRTLQSNGNMFPFMYHTALVWIWVGHKVWKEEQGGAVAEGLRVVHILHVNKV